MEKIQNVESVSRRRKIVPLNEDAQPLLSSAQEMKAGETVAEALVRCFSGDAGVRGGIAITEILITTLDNEGREQTDICLLMENEKGVRKDSPRVLFGRLCKRVEIPEEFCSKEKEYLEQYHPEDSPFVVDEVARRYYPYSYKLDGDSFVERT